MSRSIKEMLKLKETTKIGFNSDEVRKKRWILQHRRISSEAESFSIENGLILGPGIDERFGINKREHSISWPNEGFDWCSHKIGRAY